MSPSRLAVGRGSAGHFSRVCPAGAILFPEYDDPIISGRAESKKPTGVDDLDDLIDSVG